MAYESEDERAAYAGEHTNVAKSSRRRICAVVILTVALVAVLLAIVIPVGLNLKHNNDVVPQPVGAAAITAACQATSYPETCNATLSNSPGSSTADTLGLTKMSVAGAQGGVRNTLDVVNKVNVNSTSGNVTAAVEVCLEVLGCSLQQLDTVLATLGTTDPTALQAAFDELKTRLTAAMEFHSTCLDTFLEVAAGDSMPVQLAADKTNELLSNALAFVNALEKYGGDLLSWANTVFQLPDGFSIDDLAHLAGGKNRRLLSLDPSFDSHGDPALEDRDIASADDEGFPSWMGPEQRRHLLAASPPPAWNVKVAADGTGSFRKIQDAVNKAPQNNNKTQYVIYIKAGTYNEQVKIPSGTTNIMFLGDGATRTFITGSLSVALTPNMTTYNSATLSVGGDGFLAKGITVQNTAGASGHQAVAVRVSADKVAFYQCNIDSWQDTLYAHTLNQFYRECNILGTVDFIFGNANAAFQLCNIIAKKSPLLGQQNTYTAQGKTDPHMNSGVAFQSCNFAATTELAKNTTFFQTYLGRPWKPYSTAVLLRSTIQGHVDPAGWLPWNASSFGLSTSYFAEFQSAGPGANPSARVKWSKQITKLADANKFQAGVFIGANAWLPATRFPFSGVPLK